MPSSVCTTKAISVANNLGDANKSIFQTLGSLILGGAAIYSVEKAYNKQNNKLIEKKV